VRWRGCWIFLCFCLSLASSPQFSLKRSIQSNGNWPPVSHIDDLNRQSVIKQMTISSALIVVVFCFFHVCMFIRKCLIQKQIYILQKDDRPAHGRHIQSQRHAICMSGYT